MTNKQNQQQETISTKDKYIIFWTLRDRDKFFNFRETLQNVFKRKVYTRTITIYSSYDQLPQLDLFEVLLISDSLKDCINLYKTFNSTGLIYYNGTKVDLRSLQ